MDALAFELTLLQPVVEGDVSDVRDELLVEAVDTLGMGTMLAEHLGDSLCIF